MSDELKNSLMGIFVSMFCMMFCWEFSSDPCMHSHENFCMSFTCELHVEWVKVLARSKLAKIFVPGSGPY